MKKTDNKKNSFSAISDKSSCSLSNSSSSNSSSSNSSSYSSTIASMESIFIKEKKK